MEKLKVTDLVNLTEEDYTSTSACLKELKSLSNEYYQMSDLYDPFYLEEIKRKFDNKMQTLAVKYAKVKKFKGSQHVYLDEVRKKIKAQSLKILLDEGVKVTAASDLVYDSDYYTTRISLMEDIKEFMIKTEELYERYNTTFQAIVQSLSTAKKEFENSKK